VLTLTQIVNSRKKGSPKLDDSDLRKLPYLNALIYCRLSTPGQIKNSLESMREIGHLVKLAKADGYRTNITPEEIEKWMVSISTGVGYIGVISEGEVTVDVRDLGLSGRLSGDDRPGIAEMQKKISDGKIGAVYLAEGVSRLSRDKDRILPYQLLKLLKAHKVRIRTSDGVWNPAIDLDWDYLAGEFEDAIGELKVLHKRMYHRKAQKAGRGEYVGEPIPAGLFLPVIGNKSNGAYKYGKMEPYPPHASVVQLIFEKFVLHDGSPIKTKQSLPDLVFPSFPPELNYMTRLTALRSCRQGVDGYIITPTLIQNLCSNLKQAGIWKWGEQEPILKNHTAVVGEQLFSQAYNLATSKCKKRGKAAYFDPMEWGGLLWCLNGKSPYLVSSHGAEDRYVCDREYHQGDASICFDIAGRFLNEPLTSTVLDQLNFEPLLESVLGKLENEAKNCELEGKLRSRRIKKAEAELRTWQDLLPCCKDSETGEVDKEKERFYWEKIRSVQQKLKEIEIEPLSKAVLTPVDFVTVKKFLSGIKRDWGKYPINVRNRLLKLFIDKVELRGSYEIYATIYWKTGLQNQIKIHRPHFKSARDKRWTVDEDCKLRKLFSDTPVEDVVGAFCNRSWGSITCRAFRLGIKRVRQYHYSGKWREWTQIEDDELKIQYESGLSLAKISANLNRSIDSIENRVSLKGLVRPVSLKKRIIPIKWENHDFNTYHQSLSGI